MGSSDGLSGPDSCNCSTLESDLATKTAEVERLRGVVVGLESAIKQGVGLLDIFFGNCTYQGENEGEGYDSFISCDDFNKVLDYKETIIRTKLLTETEDKS